MFLLIISNIGTGDIDQSVLKASWTVTVFGIVFGLISVRRTNLALKALRDLEYRGQAALAAGGEMRDAFEVQASTEQALQEHQTELFELSARRATAASMAQAAAHTAAAASTTVQIDRPTVSAPSNSSELRQAQASLESAARNLSWAERSGDRYEIGNAKARLAVAESNARAAGG